MYSQEDSLRTEKMMQNHAQNFDVAVVLTMTDSAAAVTDHSEPVSTYQRGKKCLKVITNETKACSTFRPTIPLKSLGSVFFFFLKEIPPQKTMTFTILFQIKDVLYNKV